MSFIYIWNCFDLVYLDNNKEEKKYNEQMNKSEKEKSTHINESIEIHKTEKEKKRENIKKKKKF